MTKGLLSCTLMENSRWTLQRWLSEHPSCYFPVYHCSLEFVLWKVEDAVESLSREVLTIQAKGDKAAARSLLQSRATLTEPLRMALEKVEHMQVRCSSSVLVCAPNLLLQWVDSFANLSILIRASSVLHPHFQVPVDIVPKFGTANKLLGSI
jgi:hypothetical protein